MDTVLNNLRVADGQFDVVLMAAACWAWFKFNPGKNYADLERFLRKQGLHTHLFARRKRFPDAPLAVPEQLRTAFRPYECWFSCRPRDQARSEVLRHWPSYEANLFALNFAGSLMQRPGKWRPPRDRLLCEVINHQTRLV